MTPFMLELITADFNRTTRWFTDVLRFHRATRDDHGKFALVEKDGWRLALREGSPASTGVNIVFQVDNLDEARERLSALDVITSTVEVVADEKYRKSTCQSADGWKITLFQWDS